MSTRSLFLSCLFAAATLAAGTPAVAGADDPYDPNPKQVSFCTYENPLGLCGDYETWYAGFGEIIPRPEQPCTDGDPDCQVWILEDLTFLPSVSRLWVMIEDGFFDPAWGDTVEGFYWDVDSGGGWATPDWLRDPKAGQNWFILAEASDMRAYKGGSLTPWTYDAGTPVTRLELTYDFGSHLEYAIVEVWTADELL